MDDIGDRIIIVPMEETIEIKKNFIRPKKKWINFEKWVLLNISSDGTIKTKNCSNKKYEEYTFT